MFTKLKAMLAPSIASFGVLAHLKGWDSKVISSIDRADRWMPGIKDFEGGYYRVFQLLSSYRLNPNASIRSTLTDALSKLDNYQPTDEKLTESIEYLKELSNNELNHGQQV